MQADLGLHCLHMPEDMVQPIYSTCIRLNKNHSFQCSIKAFLLLRMDEARILQWDLQLNMKAQVKSSYHIYPKYIYAKYSVKI